MAQTTQSILVPPDTVRGLTVLDKQKFVKTISIPVLKVRVCMMHGMMSMVSQYLLKMEKLRPIQEADDANEKFIYLNPDKIKSFNSFAKDVKKCLIEMDVTKDDLIYREITLTYDNWKAHDIIAATLPPGLNFTGFSIVGSIVHVNLREELLPFKNVIGEVLREKVAHCKSVVNKVGIIDNVYRNFRMEVLSGDEATETEVKENGCRFKMDFAKVYWNSRLHEEHDRIVNLVSKGDVLYDVFCGIGPFAVPSAKKGCFVLANDLNPACYEWLNHNVRINKVSDRVIKFNKDGRSFIRHDFRKDYLTRVADKKFENSKFHVTMNLPSLADTFLSSFVNLFSEAELASVREQSLPVVYLYCFFKNKTNFIAEAKELVTQALHSSIADQLKNAEDVYHVRNVAPNKEMFRITFTLSKKLLTGAYEEFESGDYPQVKKIKLDDADSHTLKGDTVCHTLQDDTESRTLKRSHSTEEIADKKFKPD